MVTTVAYPNCCGATVLSGFSGTEDEVLRTFMQCVVSVDNRRKLTFVLNEGQIESYPRVLAEAHRVGFVLAASWINSVHNSKLFEFQRCGERIRLNAAAEQIQWPGRVLLPNMGGTRYQDPNALIPDQNAANNRHIPRLGDAGGVPNWVIVGDYVRRVTRAGIGGVSEVDVPLGSVGTVQAVARYGVVVLWRARGYGQEYTINQEGCERVTPVGVIPRMPYTPPGAGNRVVAGARITVNSPISRYHGQEHVVERIVTGEWGRANVAIFDEGRGRVSINNVIVVEPAEVQVDPWVVAPWRGAVAEDAPAFAPPMTDIYLDGEEQQWLPQQAVLQQAPARPAPPPPAPVQTVVYTAYHASYRDNRLGAGYDTLDALTAANPRVRHYVRRDHMSIGAARTGAVVEINP